MGFDPAFGGTDYTMQAAAQLTVADAVGTSTTTITSATGGFTAPMVGNGLHVNSNLYQIVTVTNSNTIIVDRTTGTFSGQTLKVGGAGSITTQGFDPVFYSVVVAGNKLWIRGTNSSGVATSYAPLTTTVATATTGTTSNPTTYEGYSTVRGDGGRPQLVAATNQMVINSYSVVKNLYINGSAATWGGAFPYVGGNGCHLENVWVYAVPGVGGVSQYGIQNLGSQNVFKNCLVDGGSSVDNLALLLDSGSGSTYLNCEFRNGGPLTVGTVLLQGGAGHTFLGCVFWNNRGVCVSNASGSASAFFRQCVFWGTLFDTSSYPGDGVEITNAQGLCAYQFHNCIFGKNAGYDINYGLANALTNPGAAEFLKVAFECNFFLTTGTARYRRLPANPGDTSLTVDPFNNSAGGDFTLNNLPGGGALITASPCVTNFVDGLNSTSVLSGFYGTVPATSDTVSMRSLWREYNNERDKGVVPDSVVDLYLDGGLQELNRRLRYHYTTDNTSVTLVAGQMEYTLPTSVLELVWVQYGAFRVVEKGDTEQWRRRGDDWRNEPAGEPRFWGHYGASLIIRPAPSSEAVAAAPVLTFRAVTVPPSVTTSGAEQLATDAWRPAVYWASYQWSMAFPDSAVAEKRGAAFKAMFDEAVASMVAFYAARNIAL